MNKNLLKEIWDRRELLTSLIVRNLKIRYKGSALGFFWSLMDPMLMVLVYFLFAKLTRFQSDISYLLTGVLIWQFLSLCIGDSFYAVLGNTSLVKKVYFPRIILPLSTAFANIINFFLTLVVLIIFLLILGVKMSLPYLIFLPVFVGLQFLLCLGLALLFSSLMVYFRDTQHLVGIGVMAWFFMSPVIYPMDLVPQKWMGLYMMNPMCVILMGFRSAFLGSPLIWNGFTSIALLICFIILGVGIWTFTRLEPYFADEL